MSEKIQHSLDIISEEFEKTQPNVDKIGLVARSVRWQEKFDSDDLNNLVKLGEYLQENRLDDSWIVEQTVFEVLCEHAGPGHVQFLGKSARMKGKHGDDRRRFALQALSGLVAKYDDADALEILEEGLTHVKKDARGWTVGFLMNAYHGSEKAVPEHILLKLADMMKNDGSADVRVEAARSLADVGYIDENELQQVVESSKALQKEHH